MQKKNNLTRPRLIRVKFNGTSQIAEWYPEVLLRLGFKLDEPAVWERKFDTQR